MQWVAGSNPSKVNGDDKKASDSNSLISYDKICLLTREQTPRPRTEYKLISVPLVIILIVLYIGYVEITPRPVQGISGYKLHDPGQGISRQKQRMWENNYPRCLSSWGGVSIPGVIGTMLIWYRRIVTVENITFNKRFNQLIRWYKKTMILTLLNAPVSSVRAADYYTT